jgi:phage tail-like protein
MSCRSLPQTFRLLDPYVGWSPGDEPGSTKHLTGAGLDQPEKGSGGLQLVLLDPGALSEADLLERIPPPRLARGCGPCSWYLLTPASRLLELDPCTQSWLPLWQECCDPGFGPGAETVAARGRRIAVAVPRLDKVFLWTDGGERLAAEVASEAPGPMAFTAKGELLVANRRSKWIGRFGPDGGPRGGLSAAVPGEIERLAVGDDCAIWLVVRTAAGALALYRAPSVEAPFQPAGVQELVKAFPPTGLRASSPLGFCMERLGLDGLPVTSCFSWCGEPIPAGVVAPPAPTKRLRQGQLLTAPLDSGIPRCRWHRVRIDADIPPGTTLSLAVSSSEESAPPEQGNAKGEQGWEDFPAGRPHPLDWQVAPAGSLDFLIDQPPGRYLFLRIRFSGDGVATPTLHRVRIDMPRSTSADFLPAVYLETPQAQDFTERFLSLFDATIAEIDRAIERYPALLDVDGVPDDLLPWLGSFLDVAFESSWDPARRRAILSAIPGIYRQRGTVAGLARTIKLIFSVAPVIEELAPERNWGGLGKDTILQGVRLFGRAKARFRLDKSTLGGAPLRSYGDPDNDPLVSHAYRFRVLVPAGGVGGSAGLARLERLVASQKPAHTVASVRVGASAWVIGTSSTVGIDTVFGHLPPPVLGKEGNVRLGRMSVLWHGRRGSRTGLTVGEPTVVGIQTVME